MTVHAAPTHTPLAQTGAIRLAQLIATGLGLLLLGAVLLAGAAGRRRA